MQINRLAGVLEHHHYARAKPGYWNLSQWQLGREVLNRFRHMWLDDGSDLDARSGLYGTRKQQPIHSLAPNKYLRDVTGGVYLPRPSTRSFEADLTVEAKFLPADFPFEDAPSNVGWQGTDDGSKFVPDYFTF